MTQVAQSVSYQSGTRQLNGYLARPEGDGPFPAVVVIHEAFGLNENIKDIARRFAGEGYAALGVDLFAGRNHAICMFRFIGGLLFNSLEQWRHPRPEGLADISGRAAGCRCVTNRGGWLLHGW